MSGTRPLQSRIKETFKHYSTLGLTSFGGPGVHVIILKQLFVTRLKWIDDRTFLDLFSLGNALPGPGSTQLAFSIAVVHNGILCGLIAFLLWSIPGAIGMILLAAGIGNIPDKLPPIVLGLLSGLNAAAVGLIGLAAVQLGTAAGTDKISLGIVWLSGSAGICYHAPWMYPVLIVLGGLSTIAWDFRRKWLVGPIKKVIEKSRKRTNDGVLERNDDIEMDRQDIPQRPDGDLSTSTTDGPDHLSSIQAQSKVQSRERENAQYSSSTHRQSILPTPPASPEPCITPAASSSVTPKTQSQIHQRPSRSMISDQQDINTGLQSIDHKESDDKEIQITPPVILNNPGRSEGVRDPAEAEAEIQEAQILNVVSARTAYCLISGFIVFLVVPLAVRGGLAQAGKQVPRELDFFASMILAGTIIFGGGPVVIPLLRDYVVVPGYVSSRDFLLIFAILQAFPGPNFNFAVALGYLSSSSPSISNRIGCAILGYIGIFSPGIILKLSLLPLYSKFRDNQLVRSLIRGLNAAASGLVFTAVWQLFLVGYIYQSADGTQASGAAGGSSASTISGPLTKDNWWAVIASGAFLASRNYKVPPWASIGLGGIAGLVWWAVRND